MILALVILVIGLVIMIIMLMTDVEKLHRRNQDLQKQLEQQKKTVVVNISRPNSSKEIVNVYVDVPSCDGTTK